ncbi:DNA-binding domain-containing protein [Vibrio ostreicida]|uniref:DNA-binding domain-containing protein n=1 Tax=Vibrio ostreicida TaxID=526588 RepID=A0ABT8BR52_9VIBR|nr:DNA-binding domain-containing protein [Vibrio ostreicida]MDN3608735.1 DNA-binding domain-containing protein [Vibrio ostreicida]NPD10583.1 DUF2063 domain-containing protein [Vibrio ostreicida]
MTLTLAELQKNFVSALLYQSTGEACCICSDRFTADERIQIYRNNFILSLTDVLRATYPMIYALVGEACFQQLSRYHVLNHPLLSGDVTEYGAQFCDTLNQFPAVAATPYLRDVAQFEWCIDQSQQLRNGQTNAPLLKPMDDLAQVEESAQADIQFHLLPGTLTFQSEFAVYSLRQAIENNDVEHLDMNQPEQGVIVSQSHGPCWTRSLTEHEYTLIQHISYGQRLGDIPQAYLPYLGVLLENQLAAGFSFTRQE